MRALVLLATAVVGSLAVHVAFGLAQLDLAGRSIDSLGNVTVSAHLTPNHLDLSHNHITELSENTTLFNFTALLVLDLSYNCIRAINGSPFRTLSELRVLNLSGNAINSISVDSFRGPEALQSLDLSCNNITELSNRLFVPLTGLQHLNLSGNRLRSLADGCFANLQRLQQLDLSWNQLTHVAPSTLQALPNLVRLLLAGNLAMGIGAKDAALLVGMGRRLQTVDASRTGLQHVPATLTHSVRTLRLAGNFIRNVRCGDLDSYPLLQLLDLTNNTLEHIEDDALGRLEMLAILYLTDNKLRAIPRSLPDRLEALHLEFNQIEQIVSGDLLGLPKLEVLLLNDNKIKVVQEGAFSQVTSLVTLDLSRNPISILPADTLAGPNGLQILRLSGLTVQPPAQDMTFPVPAPEHLVRLDLSGSAGLARQLLADTAALAAFRDLQELNLANTDLTNVRSDLLHYLPQMHNFHLTDNRLNCSGLLWLALWMRRQDQPENRQVICANPLELYGTLVVDLQDTFVTDVIFTTQSTITEINITESTTQRIQKESIDVEEITIYSNAQYDLTFNNATTEEPVNRSIVNNLKNIVKSSAIGEEMKENESNQNVVETTTITDRFNIGTTDQLELFSIASTWTDNIETERSMTSAYVDEATSIENLIGELTSEEENETVSITGPKPIYAAAAAVNTGIGGARASLVVLVILAAAIGAGATLIIQARQRRQRRYARQRDVEIDSLASVHELW